MIAILFTLAVMAITTVVTNGEVCVPVNGKTCACGISGNWTNELGSTMLLNCQLTSSTAGLLNGSYRSAVGQASDFYTLAGTYTKVNSDYILGFSVAWNNKVHGNSKSATSWTGVYYADQDKITTFWILTRYTTPANMWNNSNIGNNIFIRQNL